MRQSRSTFVTLYCLCRAASPAVWYGSRRLVPCGLQPVPVVAGLCVCVCGVGAQSRYVLSKVHFVGDELINAFQWHLIWFAIRSMPDALDVLLRID